MVQKMLEEIHKMYQCQRVEIGVFDTVKAEGCTFHTEAYDVQNMGRVTIIEMTGFLKLWKAQSIAITPLDKDAPIFYYHRHRRKGNDVLKIEIINTWLQRRALEELSVVKEKYNNIPDVEDKEEWYEEWKLPQTMLKRVKKEEAEALDNLAAEYFHAYMKEVKKSKDCERIEKKEEVEKLAVGLAEQSGMAIVQFFLAYYDHYVAAKYCNEVLFGIKQFC